MKKIVLICSLAMGLTSIASEADSSSSSTSEFPKTLFLQLDSSQSLNNPTVVWEVNETPNFLQIHGSEVLFFSQLRQLDVQFQANILEPKTLIENGELTHKFIGSGTEFSLGHRASFKVVELGGGQYEVIVYNPLGQYQRKFFAHLASQKEVQNVVDYFAFK